MTEIFKNGLFQRFARSAPDMQSGATPDRPLTEGEYRVGVTFNPSKNPTVDAIKGMASTLIDANLRLQQECESVGNDEGAWCAKHAARLIEDAAMWAVKAATKQPR